VFVGLLVAGCTVGAPPGFSGGDHWTMPLVGPLEDGLLVTPVMVNGHGPYLFAIDPDANVTAIDKRIVEEAGLRMGQGPHRIDESDHAQVRFWAQVLNLQVGSLTIDRRDAMVVPDGTYDTEGRHLRGVIGRDVLADSLVFGFDRDHGLATLTTVKAFTPPPGATLIRYQSVSSSAAATPAVSQQEAGGGAAATLPDVIPVPRRLFSVEIGDETFAMHLDLGAAFSQLREASWAKAKLAPVDVKLHLVDEAASARDVTAAGVADVMLASSKTLSVTFVPYVDQRFETGGVEGALGLDFFRPFAVYAHWDRRMYYLKGRSDAAQTAPGRLARWGAAIPVCPHPGCVTAELVGGDAGVELHATRDPQAANHALEVFLGVAPAPGKRVGPMVIELPAGASSLTAQVPADYAGGKLVVLDVSPFPRSCAGDGGCVFVLGAPREHAVEPNAAPAPLAQRNVPLDKLHRVSGEASIPPSAEVQKAASGKKPAVAIVRICLLPDGKVDTTKVVKPSGVPAYDEQLQTTIKQTWAFAPVENDGSAMPTCTSATFLPQ
jgi:TonB family protein